MIVPLSPKSEEETSFLDEPQQESRSLSGAESFTAYLAEIQAEARQKLRAAKFEAKAAAESEERESSALNRDHSCFFKDPSILSPDRKECEKDRHIRSKFSRVALNLHPILEQLW